MSIRIKVTAERFQHRRAARVQKRISLNVKNKEQLFVLLAVCSVRLRIRAPLQQLLKSQELFLSTSKVRLNYNETKLRTEAGLWGEGAQKTMNQNTTINVECLFSTLRRVARWPPRVRLIPLWGPIKRFVKSLCLDVKWAFNGSRSLPALENLSCQPNSSYWVERVPRILW